MSITPKTSIYFIAGDTHEPGKADQCPGIGDGSLGLPLPERPPKSVRPPENAEVIEDNLMFRDIFTGMQYMFQLHGTALKQSTINDRLRKVFVKFMHEEMAIFDKLAKYGEA